MNKTLLILRHELLFTLKRVGFIIMTLIIPIMAFLGIGVIRVVSEVIKPAVAEEISIGYVDGVGGFNQFTNQGNIKLVLFNAADDAAGALIRKDISEYFIIPPDYLSKGIINRYTLEKQLETPPGTVAAIKVFITSNILSGKVPQGTINIIESPLNLVVTRLTETGVVASEQGGYGNLIIPAIFSFLLALSLTFGSNYLLQGLGEEKESRLIEVLLSSVSTRQLLTGKVLGLGAAGLIQVVVWLVSAPLLLRLASSTFGGFFSTIQLPANFIVLGIVYFVLGYLLFAVLSAGVGAISPNAREGQQLAAVFTVFAISPLWFSSLLMLFPKSPIWVVLTIFPITAPVEVMLRLGVSGVQTWELAASIAVMVLSIVGILFLVIKVFRVYLLMYGKRPGMGEIIRSLRNS
jgi:ABC-2 type transport system permease protein